MACVSVSTRRTLTLRLGAGLGSRRSRNYKQGGSGVELPYATPSLDHLEFEQMCSEVEDFEPLPTLKIERLEPDKETEEESSLDGQILAGLVSPY